MIETLARFELLLISCHCPSNCTRRRDGPRHDSTLIVVDQLEPEGLVSDNASYIITVQHKAKKGLTSVMLVMG